MPFQAKCLAGSDPLRTTESRVSITFRVSVLASSRPEWFFVHPPATTTPEAAEETRPCFSLVLPLFIAWVNCCVRARLWPLK